MGARRLVAVCIAACLVPGLAWSKGEHKESPADGEYRVMAVQGRRAEPGWAARQQAMHLLALGAQGKKHALGAVNRALHWLPGRRSQFLRWADDGPTRRIDGIVGSVTSTLKAATHGRKLLAPKALGEQAADIVRKEDRLDP